ncbi:hypothetical protein KDU71_02405 [Carboxylicivirga sediminis]|uniref:DUF2335 domain-containing protein n=1 Tax=Carboxylicivirga sediminis TaxID=2006564 RepID=A0A941EZH4_9BACT|nr:hypothetical protein [Carboxylicivirga sediminis]MBR8534396.1 hypothetical protein [Carboxylicivirga sediminis]
MSELQKHESESDDSALLTIIVEKGMEAVDKALDKYADAEKYKADKHTEIELRKIETANKRIEATERIKNKESIVGGIAIGVLVGVIVWLSVIDKLNVGNTTILVTALTGAIGKFLGVSFPKSNSK